MGTWTVTCTHVMAGPENIKAGFLKERDIFAENNVVYASTFITLGATACGDRATFLERGA